MNDDDNKMLPLWLSWQQGGFEAITDSDALLLHQWVLSGSCSLNKHNKEHYLRSYDWEMLNRERMTMINQFFRLRPGLWGIRLAIRKNPEIHLVHLGEQEFEKQVGTKPRKLLRVRDGVSEWTRILLPQPAFRGCLYSCLDNVRKKGGLAYLLGNEMQLQMKF